MNDIYESYNLLLEPFYDNNSAYYHILTINKQPKGPLGNYVKLMPIKNISTKINKANENYCSFVIKKSLLFKNILLSEIIFLYCLVAIICSLFSFFLKYCKII